MWRWAALTGLVLTTACSGGSDADPSTSPPGFCDDDMTALVEAWFGEPVNLEPLDATHCEVRNLDGPLVLVLTDEPAVAVERESGEEPTPAGATELADYLTERLDPSDATAANLAALDGLRHDGGLVADCGLWLSAGEDTVTVFGRPSQMDVAPLERGTFGDESQRVVLRVEFGTDLPGQGCSDLADENVEPTITTRWPVTAEAVEFVPPEGGQACGAASMAVTGATVLAPTGERVELGDLVLRNTGYGHVGLMPGFGCGEDTLEFGDDLGPCEATIVTVDSAPDTAKAGAECFENEVKYGRPATWDLLRFTDEGAPIATRYAYAQGVVTVTTDSTADFFGTPVVHVKECSGVEVSNGGLRPTRCQRSEGPGFDDASLAAAGSGPDGFGTAAIAPPAVRPREWFTITPRGVVPRVCGQFAQVFTPADQMYIGQFTADGTFVPATEATVPPCDPAPSAEPLRMQVGAGVRAGRYLVCVGGLTPEGCGTIEVR